MARPKAGKQSRKRTKSKKDKRRVRYFTDQERRHALKLVVAGMVRAEVAKSVGCSTESLRLWYNKAEADGTLPKPPRQRKRRRSDASDEDGARTGSEPAGDSTAIVVAESGASDRSIYTTHDPGQGLATYEVDGILEYKKRHPSMQPAQLKAQLKRFKGWRLSIKAIARVLKAHGYETVHRGSRPQGPEPIRFEAPRRGALWQADFGEFRVAGERLHLLVVLDDFSRYAVGHSLSDSPSAEVVIATLGASMARHGKPETLRTDRGGAFTSGELKSYLERELIDHMVGRSYHPQGGGKVESLIGTVRRELWDVEHFDDRQMAERRLVEFFDDYNERRAHMGIDGLTPADRFCGRGDKVLAAIDSVSRRRQGSLAMLERSGATFEELSPSRTRAPLEVLRLVIVDGAMELRFCGARVRLGTIEA